MLELLKVLQNAQISHGNCTNSRSNCGILEIGEPVWRIGEGISNRFPSPHSQLRSFADSPDPVSHNHIRHYKVWNIFLDRPLSVSQSPITIIHLGQLFPTNQYFYFTFSSPAKRWLLDKMGLSEQVCAVGGQNYPQVLDCSHILASTCLDRIHRVKLWILINY